MCVTKFGSYMFLLVVISVAAEGTLHRSGGFRHNPELHFELPYRTIPIPSEKTSSVHGAAECVRDEMCLSYDIADGVAINLYTGYVRRGGTHYLITRCPSMALMRYSRVLDMCYRISDNLTNWLTANDTCHQQGGRLIVLDTDRKFTQFRAEYTEAINKTFWMGARLTGTRWYWINGQEILLTNSNWHSDNPNLGENACVDSGSYYHQSIGMADQNCGRARYSICEF